MWLTNNQLVSWHCDLPSSPCRPVPIIVAAVNSVSDDDTDHARDVWAFWMCQLTPCRFVSDTAEPGCKRYIVLTVRHSKLAASSATSVLSFPMYAAAVLGVGTPLRGAVSVV